MPSKEIKCSHESCTNTIKDHEYAKEHSGWFFMKSGLSYCKAHSPRWVESWERKKEKIRQEKKQKELEAAALAEKEEMENQQ